MNKLFTKIVGVCLGLTMAVGVGVAVASNSKEATPVHATSSPVEYGPATFSTGLPSDGYWTGSGGGSYCGGYGKNKNNAWSVTLDFNSATDIDWSSVDFSHTVSLTTSVKAAGNDATGNVVLSINNTAAQSNTHAITSDFGSGSNIASAKAVAMNISSVSSSFSEITINFPAKSFIYQFSCSLSFTEKASSDTLDAITNVSATITARAGADHWTISSPSATGTISGTTGQNVTSLVDFSVSTAVPSVAGNTTVALRATKKSGVAGDATYYEKNVSATVEEVPLETTYDFRTKFGTYAKDWGTSYASKTVQGVSDVGGDYAATITFALVTKQTSNITTMPVVADQASGDVVHVTFELTESGYELGNVSVTFAQWNTKAPTMKLFKGDSATGTVLDSGVVGTKNTISATDVGGTKFVVAMNDDSTSRNQVGIQSIYITLKAAPVLSSVTTSGQKTTFEYGDTFSYGGTLTAHYTQGKADATVSPSKFKFGASGINPDSAGTDITVGTALSHATHDGKYIYVGYTEDSSTYKWASYQITVEDAPTYYIVLDQDVATDTGYSYAYKGDMVYVIVLESNLAGNITWTVTAGSVTDVYFDDECFGAEVTSVGTLTIVATDSGYTSNTQAVSITVVDSLNTVMAPYETHHASDLTFTAQAGGSGTADDGATYTVTSDAAESTYEEARGIHFGTNSSATVQYVQLSSSDVASGENDVIKSVVVNASDAQTEGNTASLTVTVGGKPFHCSDSATATLGGQATYTFTGSGSGTVVIRAERTEAKYKGIYFKSVDVNYVTTGKERNIANEIFMHLAQKAVIDYAKDFNDTLEGICVAYGSTDTSDLKDAWDDLATQYTSWFTNTGKSLTSKEKAHAKALFANASSVDRNVTASADELQHMLAKYDWIVSHYSNCGDFLNTDAGTGRDPVPQTSNRAIPNNIMQNGNTVAIIVVISMISITCIGGYFFLRKRKED